ncbi:peptidase domain-containing ABC transporter [Sphingomonas alpina]|uniref:Peptidase domain-containing ABC transporter n=1 Tax=Sphingomonas alpina TaxID=653931 RepID=A0A7H0LEU2_9SPHN|nr:peptidase domain-containing ABC transporter [Sphingomonas alpina]QNQ08195.1 peptidase domain-containing ABC transporter [Sphingomonas alpina]
MSGTEWPWSRRIRPILQSEVNECGLACLAMAAANAGHRVDLAGLRRRYPISSQGMTLAELMRIAGALELSPRAVRLEIEELGELQLPAILHWDLTHFVLLERVSGSKITILDPAVGRRTISLQETSRHLTGVALELTPSPDFTPIVARSALRISDLWTRITRLRGTMVQVVGLSLLLQVTVLALPFAQQIIVDEAIGQGDNSLVLLIAIGFGFVYLLNVLLQALRSWVVLTLGESISFQLAGNLVRHLIHLPVSFFERRHVGDLLSRIQSIKPIQELLTQGVVNVAIDALLALTTLIVMMLISPTLALVVLITSALYALTSLVLFPQWRARSEEEIVARAKQETHLLETMRSVRAIKLHGMETMREAGWRNLYADVVSSSYRADRTAIQLTLAENLLFNLQLLLVLAFAASMVIAGTMTIGLMFAFLSYRTSFATSASQLVHRVQDWRMIGLHLDRLADIVSEKQEQIGLAPPRANELRPPAIRVERLSFAYSPTDPPILQDVSFDVPAGSYLAIIGRSGSGKTTLLRLLLGLLTPTSGQILIDGVPLGPATIAAWRSRVGAVLQDDAMLQGTIADNIAFFDPHADMEDIISCASFARIHDEIMQMPMQYHSFIGDMGGALSAGQRQRLLLARAMYRSPDAVFLDEGTANLDEANETALAESFARLRRTRIVIAHRPALIEHAVQVIELDQGGVTILDTGAPRLQGVA